MIRSSCRSIPTARTPAACDGCEDGQHFGPSNGLIVGGGPEGDPKVSDPGIGVVHAFADQAHLGAGIAIGQGQQFYPIADCANWADKVVADARPDKCS